MDVSADQFKDALRFFASGVTLVTASHGDARHGLTVSAFVSVSADPPLIAVLIEASSSIHLALEKEGAGFAVNVLADDQVELSNRFAFNKDEDRFLVGSWAEAETGAPVLEDALAWLDCRLESRQIAGSHVLYMGRVLASRVNRAEGQPLLYWNRSYHRLGSI